MTHLTDYRGHKIELTQDFVFLVSGPLFDPSSTHAVASMHEAKSKIDDATAAEEKQKKTAVTLALPAIKGDGSPFMIRGINSNSSRILGTEERSELFAPAIWIAKMLVERKQLTARLREIQSALRPVTISTRRGYGHLKAADYPGEIAELQKEYDAAVAAAKKGVD